MCAAVDAWRSPVQTSNSRWLPRVLLQLGATLLHGAASFGKKDNVAKLVSRGASVDAKDDVRCLLAYALGTGANVDAVTCLTWRWRAPCRTTSHLYTWRLTLDTPMLLDNW